MPSDCRSSFTGHFTHCVIHSPVTCPVVTFSRFQALIAAMEVTNAASAGSS